MVVRPLQHPDRAAWETLWAGYQAFYRLNLPPETTELTWRRFHDPTQPIHALGAIAGGRLAGIVHYIYHLSSVTPGPYCYLQDLFTDPAMRNQGIARALIQAVYDAAQTAGASRVYWLTHQTNATAIALYDMVAEPTGFIHYRKLLT